MEKYTMEIYFRELDFWKSRIAVIACVRNSAWNFLLEFFK